MSAFFTENKQYLKKKEKSGKGSRDEVQTS